MTKMINPYTFVNLPPKRSNAKHEEGVLTGKIKCFLYPRTHMFIPNTTNDKVFSKGVSEHKSYDFYSYKDLSVEQNPSCAEPIIPGSSIRGEIRSLYEALSNSCLSAVDNDLILSKRLPNPGEIGILKIENGVYTLFKATKYMACYRLCKADNSPKRFNGGECGSYFDKKQLSEGQKIYFKPSNKKYKDKKYMPITVDEIRIDMEGLDHFLEGYVLIGEPLSGKHHFTIAETKYEAGKTISKEELQVLERILKLYGDSDAKDHNGYSAYKTRYEAIKNSGGKIPIYYKEIGSYLYLSPACISKEVYKNQLHTLLAKGNYNPCQTMEAICPACKLFGFVGQDGNADTALPGRLRFSDARIDNKGAFDQLFENQAPLNILATPKISSTEFYLQYPNFDYTHFDEMKHSETEKKKIQPTINVSKKGVMTGKGFDALSAMMSFKTTENESLIDIFPMFDEKKEPKDAELMWTYDTAFNWSKQGKIKPEPIPFYEPSIKGRKFYWHHNQHCCLEDFLDRDGPNKMNATVRLLKPCAQEAKNGSPDYRFFFTVYFDRLTHDELEKLIATLRLGGKGYHSIGHGKPLGMGSAKIVVDKVELRELSIEAGKIIRTGDKAYDYKKQSLLEAFPESKACARQVEIITQIHEFDSEIAYPTPEDSSIIYKWFSNNRGPMNRPTIKQILPNIPTANMTKSELEDAISLTKN